MSYVPKILIVDDEPRMCDSLKLLLDNEGYETQTSYNGRQALEYLSRHAFDLVLLNFVLPDTNGAEMMDRINSQNPEIFVIVITGYASTESAVDSLRRRAFDYLKKPFEYEELSKVVNNALMQKRLESERKRAEQALRDSEANYRLLFSAESDAILVADAETRHIVDANEAALKLYGYSREECLKLKATELSTEPEKSAIHIEKVALGKPAVASAGPVQRLHKKKDGTVFPVEISSGAYALQDRKMVCGIIRDVSERKRAEESLQRSKQEWETTFNAIFDWVVLIDLNRQILRSNRVGEAFVGVAAAEIVGQNCCKLIHGSVEPIPGCPVQKMLQTRQRQSAEVNLPDRNCWLNIVVDPVIDESGNLVGAVHIARDVTEHKQAEQETKRLQAQLQQAQKMEAIGTLAGGIAHDFNNLLMGIQGNISLMQVNMNSKHPHYQRLKSIEKLIQSGANLTSKLLGYARKGRYEVKPVSLNQLVEETLDTFARTRKQITIYRELADDLFTIKADQGQIEQVLWNLFANAADAMPAGGDLIIKTLNTTHQAIKGESYKPKPGNYALLMVTDTGIGMDKETLERIFDPFFTTKEMGRGTGLGLASVYGIIKGHEGYVDVDSRKGQGTTFKIYLPASEKSPQCRTK